MQKIAIIQLDVKAGHFEQNFNKAVKWILQAKEMGAELVVLPEMCLSGSFVGDKWFDIDFLNDSKKYAEKLIEASQNIAMIFGAIYTDSEKIGQGCGVAKYNCAYICENGKLLCLYAKRSLQNRGFFNEHRYFLPGAKSGIVEMSSGLKIGVEIGDDFCEEYCDVDIAVNISASPWVQKKNEIRNNKVPTVYANCCGCQNTGKNILVFDGNSCFYNRDGNREGQVLKPYEEGILFCGKTAETKAQLNKVEMQTLAIQRAYKGMDEMLCFEPKYVFGLSGGIDSSLACSLAVKTFGSERVIGYNFPSEYSSEKTKKSAEQLAKNLGVEYNIVPIEGIQREVEKALGKFPAIVKENIQAKIRCTDLLSNFAQIHGGVMTCNGNKLELAMGYATLYGDTGGMFAPLGDLLKTEIFEIAKSIEEIPRELIPNENMKFEEWQIYPSAELSSGQRDPMKFGYHDKLLEALMSRKISFSQTRELYSKGSLFSFLELSQQLVEHYNLNCPQIFEQDLDWFSKRFNSMAFKRMQSPPVLIMSNSAFGSGFLENLS